MVASVRPLADWVGVETRLLGHAWMALCGRSMSPSQVSKLDQVSTVSHVAEEEKRVCLGDFKNLLGAQLSAVVLGWDCGRAQCSNCPDRGVILLKTRLMARPWLRLTLHEVPKLPQYGASTKFGMNMRLGCWRRANEGQDPLSDEVQSDIRLGWHRPYRASPL